MAPVTRSQQTQMGDPAKGGLKGGSSWAADTSRDNNLPNLPDPATPRDKEPSQDHSEPAEDAAFATIEDTEVRDKSIS